MNPLDFIQPSILHMKGYVPGIQKNEPSIIKLNSNENPFPASKAVLEALKLAINESPLEKYPNPWSLELRQAIAKRYDCKAEQVIIGNGSDEILTMIFRSFLNPTTRLVIPDPTYSLYQILANIIGNQIKTVHVLENWHINFEAMLTASNEQVENQHRTSLVILAHPNAPTGLVEKKSNMMHFLKECSCPVLLDEAYADFTKHSWAGQVGHQDFPGLMVSGTFSKSYSLAGMRIGWLVAPEAVIAELDKIRDSYNINRLSQVAALAAIQDTKEFNRRIDTIIESRNYLYKELQSMGFDNLDGQGNFLMVRPKLNQLTSPTITQSLFEYLEGQNILIRYFRTEQLNQWLRISIGNTSQMELLVFHTKAWLLSQQ